MNNLKEFYIEYPNFDWKFYLSFYKDLSQVFNTEQQAVAHYINYGNKEERIFNLSYIKNNQESVKKIVNSLYIEQANIHDISYQNFTILIRSNKRPNYFQRCIDSIFLQKYPKNNIDVCVSYHNEETYNYLIQYKNINLLKLEQVQIDKNNNNLYPYNLYLNYLLKTSSNNSWVIIIDDDDLFVNEYSLSTINYEINKICNIQQNLDFTLHWRVWRCDKLVGNNGFNHQICDPDIALCGFCFHGSNIINLCFDTNRVSRSIQQFCSNFNIYWTKYIITKIGQEDELAGYGEIEYY